jgi:hypothetical protein
VNRFGQQIRWRLQPGRHPQSDPKETEAAIDTMACEIHQYLAFDCWIYYDGVIIVNSTDLYQRLWLYFKTPKYLLPVSVAFKNRQQRNSG